ncbi:MAG TPA: thiamine pyrophosphate-binding protein [Thermodesulfobacteriota bacterium]|nr:thiamine pyrophosphate-binding protein [Thermodesulfobacteriota bacterium]
MKSKMTGAQYIACAVSGYGITHVFYVEAILRRTLVEMEKLGISRVITHGEKGAAYMADGYARAGNRPGLCMAQSVGAANLAAGLQDAYLGRSPVIAFTGRKPPLYQYRNSYQEILHNTMYQAVTKYNVEVGVVEQLPHLMLQAFREATTGSPGPAHLDFLGYEGNLTDEAEAELVLEVEREYTRMPARRPVPEESDLRRAAEALGKAERPALVVGRGAILSGAHAEVLSLARHLGAPVIVSMDGKSIITEDDPLYAGPAGTYCAPCANEVLAESDLVFFVGSSTGDQVTKNWTLPPVGSPVIQLDINPTEIGRSYPGAIGLLGDARVGLAALSAELGGNSCGAKKNGWAEKAGSVVAQWRASVEPQRTSDAVPIRPERLCADISAELPEGAIVVADTGYSAIWAGTLIDLFKPGQLFLRAAGSLGWGFPASLGAKCAQPSRPVVCFSGDGAFWYHLGELETAVRWKINTVTVINNNSVLGQCQLGIRRAYRGEKAGEEQQYRFTDTNFARVAEDLGAVGIRVEKPSEIRPAIRRALSLDKPVVVDVATEPESHPHM